LRHGASHSDPRGRSALLAELRRIIVEAGHDVVDAPEEADVLMHDARGEAPAASRR